MRVLSPNNKWIKSHESTHNGIVLRMFPQSLLNFVFIMIETKFLNVAHMVEVVTAYVGKLRLKTLIVSNSG